MTMTRRNRRESFGGAVSERSSANDAVRSVLTRYEKRLRRIAGTRAKPVMKRAYREAAERVRGIIPR